MFLLVVFSKSNLYKYNDDMLKGVLYSKFIENGTKYYETFKVSPSSEWSDVTTYDYNKATNLLDWSQNHKRWHSRSQEFPSITIEFVDSFLMITNYTLAFDIKSRAPISWFFEGSNDNRTWNVISTISNNSLNNDYETKIFSVPNSIFRFFKIKMISNNYEHPSYANVLVLKRIEFFGYLGGNEPYLKSFFCLKSSVIMVSNFVLVIFFLSYVLLT